MGGGGNGFREWIQGMASRDGVLKLTSLVEIYAVSVKAMSKSRSWLVTPSRSEVVRTTGKEILL